MCCYVALLLQAKATETALQTQPFDVDCIRLSTPHVAQPCSTRSHALFGQSQGPHHTAPHDHQSASTRRHHLSLGALTAACRHHMASTCHHHTASPCRHQPHTRKRKNAQWFSLSKSGTHVLLSTASKSHHQATQQHPPDSHLQPHLSAAHYPGAYRVFQQAAHGPRVSQDSLTPRSPWYLEHLTSGLISLPSATRSSESQT